MALATLLPSAAPLRRHALSTVFPAGMYAACSFVVAAVAAAVVTTGFARVWLWVAVAVGTIVLVAVVRRAVNAPAAQPSPRQRGTEHPSKHRAG